MLRNSLPKAAMAAGTLIAAALPVMSTAALAQDGPPVYSQQPYGQQPYGQQPAYDQQGQPGPGGDYRSPPPPPEPTAPEGYDGRQMPPPPPGYVPPPNYEAQREADARYAAEAQRWARDNCVKSHGDVATGAVVGGIFGALMGGALGGRHAGGAIVAGTMLGAGAGAAVASSSNGDTSPGCPPGYVVRRDAPPYAFGYSDYYYAAPGWYSPWVFIDGSWAYRPYPYHDYYWHTWRGGYRGGYRGGDWHGGHGGDWHGGGHGGGGHGDGGHH